MRRLMLTTRTFLRRQEAAAVNAIKLLTHDNNNGNRHHAQKAY
jgi:hypothetical protein